MSQRTIMIPSDGPTVPALAFRALKRFAGRTAFAWEGGVMTYAGALDMIGRVQAAMSADRPAPRRLALLSSNRAEAWCAEIAVQALGGSFTWLHPMASLADHAAQLEDAQADALLVDVPSYSDRGGQLAGACPSISTIWTMGPADFGVDLLAAAASAGACSPRDLSRPRLAASLNYTGGTTGRPKAALRRQRNQAAMYLSVLTDFELPQVPRYLAAAPISHVGGTKVLPTLMRGGSVHLMKAFDPDRLLDTIERECINMSLLVPTMIYKLLEHPALARTDTSSLELLLYGASPMSPTRLLEGIERLGPVFSQLYGQTECYPISLLRKADHDPRHPDTFASCGTPLSTCDVRLLDEQGGEVQPGATGEICVRAAQAMESYWNRPELSAEVFAGEWLHTGDMARMDDRGYVYIVDRKKDVIVSGGFNVYPREVEDVLATHEAVAISAVIGVPDETWGEAVLAVVARKPGMSVDAETLIRLVKQRKGSQQAPKRVEFVDALPLTALGKLDKKALREPFWAGHTRKVA
jgi:fatty-acyl-CoA synthase